MGWHSLGPSNEMQAIVWQAPAGNLHQILPGLALMQVIKGGCNIREIE